MIRRRGLGVPLSAWGPRRIAVLCLAAAILLLAMVAARGSGAMVTAPPDPHVEWEPAPRTEGGAVVLPSDPTDQRRISDGLGPVLATVLLVVLGLMALAGVLLLVMVGRRRRRVWVGVGGLGPADVEPGEAAPDRFRDAVELARAELAARTGGPPDNAVIAAWVALEEAAGTERAPHQTATEYAGTLLGDYTSDTAALDELRGLYHRARFGSARLTEHDVDRARAALDRITR